MSASFAVVLQTKKSQPQYMVHAQLKWKSHPFVGGRHAQKMVYPAVYRCTSACAGVSMHVREVT